MDTTHLYVLGIMPLSSNCFPNLLMSKELFVLTSGSVPPSGPIHEILGKVERLSIRLMMQLMTLAWPQWSWREGYHDITSMVGIRGGNAMMKGTSQYA